jgi:signal transduction histidine kinase
MDAENTLEINADERLLVSAVSNLLQNALKFTRPGGQVILRGRTEEGTVVIEVEDECGGLPPGKHEELFTPYVQRHSQRRGLGLGLAITREAVEAHGGEVSVRNLPGKGCVFAVKLRNPVPPQEA